MAAALQLAQDLTPITCCSCGMLFAVPSVLEANWREKKTSFACPLGHSLVFGGETATALLRKERDLHAAVLACPEGKAVGRRGATQGRSGGEDVDRRPQAVAPPRGQGRVPMLQAHRLAARRPHGDEAPGVRAMTRALLCILFGLLVAACHVTRGVR